MLPSNAGEMNRCAILVLALTLLAAAAACTPSPRLSLATGSQLSPAVADVSPTPTAAPTFAPPTLDGSGVLSTTVDSTDPSEADQAVRDAVDWAREASGLRAALGPHADELFRLVEQAQAALAEKILAPGQPGAKPKGMPAPLPPLRWAPRYVNAMTSLILVATFLTFSPRELSATPSGDAGPQVKEYDQAFGENATAHVKRKTQITGSKLEMELEMTLRAEKDGTVYEEKAKGKINLNLCPDGQGNVPLDLTLQSAAGSGDKGFEMNIALHAVGHVDDEANLAGYDQDGQTEVILRTGRNLFGGVNTEQAQVQLGWSLSGLNTPDSKGMAITNARESISLGYLFASQGAKDIVNNLAAKFSTMELILAFKSAESKWQEGFCVAIQVAEGASQTVKTGSETAFTASVRHQFEGKELAVPVIATLKSGAVSVTPAGKKVPAPAAFRYKAPDTSGVDATVELVSRSRRGIGKLNITFMTEQLHYHVDTVFGLYSWVPLSGEICAFDKPFTLDADGHNPSGGKYIGEIVFTPASAESGSWVHTASSNVGSMEGAVGGNSTYQVEGLAAGHPVIKMNATTAYSKVKGFTATYEWPAWQIDLEVVEGACSSQ